MNALDGAGAVKVVAGWAMDDHGLREIRLYVDGPLRRSRALKQARRRGSPTLYTRFGEKNGWVGTVISTSRRHVILIAGHRHRRRHARHRRRARDGCRPVMSD